MSDINTNISSASQPQSPSLQSVGTVSTPASPKLLPSEPVDILEIQPKIGGQTSPAPTEQKLAPSAPSHVQSFIGAIKSYANVAGNSLGSAMGAAKLALQSAATAVGKVLSSVGSSIKAGMLGATSSIKQLFVKPESAEPNAKSPESDKDEATSIKS